MHTRKLRGFTIQELLIVCAVIGLLSSVVIASIIGVRKSNRDAQVLAHKQAIILALKRIQENDPNHEYPDPGVPGAFSYCLKPSGTCWGGYYYGNATLANLLAPYFPGGIPQPPGTKSGEWRHDAYKYEPFVPANWYGNGNPAGAYIVWALEKPITNCNGAIVSTTDVGIYYCAEKLPD